MQNCEAVALGEDRGQTNAEVTFVDHLDDVKLKMTFTRLSLFGCKLRSGGRWGSGGAYPQGSFRGPWSIRIY